MSNPYYNHGSWPAVGASGASTPARAEFDAVAAGFALLPALTANRVNHINAAGTAIIGTSGFTFDGTTFTAPVIATPGTVSIASGQRIYLDGVAASGNTFITEGAADQINFYAGAVSTLVVDATGVAVTGGVSTTTESSLISAGRAALFKTTGGATQETAGIWNNAASGDNLFVDWRANASADIVGSVDYNRGGGAVRYNTTSDQRLKNDLGLATDTSILSALEIHNFTWRETGHKSVGVFAQEAYQVFPDAISKGTDGDDLSRPWQASYSTFVPSLIVGWQDHDRRIKALEARA